MIAYMRFCVRYSVPRFRVLGLHQTNYRIGPARHSPLEVHLVGPSSGPARPWSNIPHNSAGASLCTARDPSGAMISCLARRLACFRLAPKRRCGIILEWMEGNHRTSSDRSWLCAPHPSELLELRVYEHLHGQQLDMRTVRARLPVPNAVYRAKLSCGRAHAGVEERRKRIWQILFPPFSKSYVLYVCCLALALLVYHAAKSVQK